MRIIKGTVRKEEKRISMTKFFFSFMECRMPGGFYFEQIAADISESEPFSRLLFDVLTFIAGSKVFCIDREHEFVTEKVQPEFIVFE